MNEKTVNIDNFIGVYDNYITKEECNRAIKLYEDENKWNRWSTDGCCYFKKMFKVPTLDYENLITYKNYDVSKDRYYVYYQNRKIKASSNEEWIKYTDTIDTQSFKVLGFNHYIDKYSCINIYGRVYHGGNSCK